MPSDQLELFCIVNRDYSVVPASDAADSPDTAFVPRQELVH